MLKRSLRDRRLFRLRSAMSPGKHGREGEWEKGRGLVLLPFKTSTTRQMQDTIALRLKARRLKVDRGNYGPSG
jgi:hypothetical protein